MPMEKERIAALVIGSIMLFSVAGFATFGLRFTGGSAGQRQQPEPIPLIAERFLTGQEISSILSQGGTVIESVYNRDCSDCSFKDQQLRDFARKYRGFVVLESVKTEYGEGFEKLQMISSRGEIINLEEEEITQENLLNIFCGIALFKPRECLLKDFNEGQAKENNGSGTPP
jgi:hypothetical protein